MGEGKAEVGFNDSDPLKLSLGFNDSDPLNLNDSDPLKLTSVEQVIATITAYIDQRNENPKPFVWTATVRDILKKVGKGNATLATLH